MRKVFLMSAMGVAAFGLSACDVDQTEEGALPDVDVEGGALPEYDVEAPEVEVGTEETTVEVPTIDVTTEDAQGAPATGDE